MSNSSPAIFAVVLAAGSGRRFGGTKQLARVGDETLVRRAARVAREVCGERSLLVAGHDAAAVVEAAGGECRFVAINERHREGLGSSLALAARVLSGTADAFVLTLADQPRITPEHLRALMAAWDGVANRIVATAYAETVGAPAVLPAATFGRLAALAGDVGARALFGEPDIELASVRFEAAATDVDRPEDLAAIDA